MIKNFFLDGFDAKNKQYENSKIDIAPVVHIGYFKFAIVPSYTAKYPCYNTALNWIKYLIKVPGTENRNKKVDILSRYLEYSKFIFL